MTFSELPCTILIKLFYQWWRGKADVAQTINNLPAIQETPVQSLDPEDPLERGMATDSSILAWRIPQMEEPDGLPCMEWQGVTHDRATNTHIPLSTIYSL